MLFRNSCALIVLVVATTAASDEIAVQRPFLWQISSEADGHAEHTHYLFGTIHVSDESLTKRHPLVQQAWDKTDVVCFEIDFIRFRNAQTNAISLSADQRLEDIVPPDLLRRLDQRLARISPMANRDSLPKAHIVVWPILLGSLQAQAENPSGLPMDLNFYRDAKLAGKEVGGLEKPEEQLHALIELPRSDQLEFLRRSLDGLDQDDAEGINRLDLVKQHYASGDAKRFSQFLNDEFKRVKLPEELAARINRGLLVDRNQRMADELGRRIHSAKGKTVLAAVGVGHLVGEKTVQSYLTAQGFRVERVSSTDTVTLP